MGDVTGFDHLGAFQLTRLKAELLEQADALSEQHRHHIDLDFVQYAQANALLRDVRPTDADVLVPGDFFRLGDGALDAVGDEGEWRGVSVFRLSNGRFSRSSRATDR